MKVTVELSSLNKDDDKIFGNIYFEENEYAFPEKGWNDFVIIILNWWAKSILKLLKNISIEEELDFMDGPASVKVQYLKNNSFSLYFILNKEVVYSSEVDVELFTKAFLKELNSLIRNIKENRWESEEIYSLMENYKMLQKCFIP
ncbi:hypothetical protein [Flavivirga jejuensis]|uniref:Immunity protein 8 of polymorphic toxin system n=1 Tax=Flavivirga jejuensis TaxID=870487 RepID=A0ABT8WPC2_9FLAO|nr:hypothetical protein [Flavivirga jejuensis]MDO5975019.1 hypothetical protein [Flavivirga jejuensis]